MATEPMEVQSNELDDAQEKSIYIGDAEIVGLENSTSKTVDESNSLIAFVDKSIIIF